MDWTAPPPAEALTGAPLLNAVHTSLTRYCVLPVPEAADAVVLWCAATHALPALPAAPRLVVTSAVKRSGKTRLLDVAERLVYRPLVTMNATVPAIFRSLGGKHPPTLIFDEVDTIFGSARVAEQNEDLRGLLNAGFQPGKPTLRCVGPMQTPTPFATYAMAALAGIGGVPDTIRDRAVNIRMRRRKDGETAAPFRERRDGHKLLALGEQLTAWLTDPLVLAVLEGAEPQETGLEDRAADVWEPLLMVADVAGGDWAQRARNAAKRLTADDDGEDDDSAAVRLLHDIHDVLTTVKPDFVPTSVLLEQLRRIEEAPWREDDLTARGAARLLRVFGISSTRDSTGKTRGYKRTAFDDAFARYPRTAREDP